MKIYCDFCGSQIETSENKTCPNCGGYYSTDEELLKEKERVRQLNELEMEKQQLDIERMKLENRELDNRNNLAGFGNMQTNKGAKGCLFGVITALCIFGIFFILMIVCIFADSADEKSTKKNAVGSAPRTSISINYNMDMNLDMPEISTDNSESTLPVTYENDGAKAVTDKYTISCEHTYVIKPKNYKPAEGNSCLMIKLVFENTSEKKMFPYITVSCLCDGFVCSRVYSVDKKAFSASAVPAGAKLEGYYCFEVPTDAKNITLVYDNTINLEIPTKALSTSPSD